MIDAVGGLSGENLRGKGLGEPVPGSNRGLKSLLRMSVQQFAQPNSSANGYGRREVEREGASRVDNKLHSVKSSIGKMANTHYSSGNKFGGFGGASRDRLVYFSTCLIGHHVEIQVKNGSVYTGIFHAANVDRDFGIILKMAHLTKDMSAQLQNTHTDSLGKAFSKTLIVPAKDLVQIVAKDVSVTRDEISNEYQSERQRELLIDSYISRARPDDMERELKPWVPEDNDPHCAELENLFDDHWKRGWDQFEVNEALFGVKSTFNEELYTTKLERGPRMRQLELEASRIAKEIEREDTRDLHLAEERGINLPESEDVDEETRFSSVYRGRVADDSGYEEEEDILLDIRNGETFDDAASSVIEKVFSGIAGGIDSDDSLLSSRSSMDVPQVSQSKDSANALSSKVPDINDRLLLPDRPTTLSQSDGEIRFQRTITDPHRANTDTSDGDQQKPVPHPKFSGVLKADDSVSSSGGHDDCHNGDGKGGSSSKVTTSTSSQVSMKEQSKKNPTGDQLETQGIPGEKLSVESHGRPGSSVSSTSDRPGRASASAGAGLTPSSSVGSLSSEKSMLNPNTKEFKLNPNAKSFVPSQAPVRPISPVGDSSFYFHANLSGMPQMHGMPVGVGLGPYVAHQPVIFNPQVAPVQSPQAYLPPAGPHYGQPMLIGHPRPFSYGPGFSPEMPYKGREF
ncbi:hypothetical protein MLD38_007874 [Melastoma candidum]|uniref:Uncharacterized protein n=1 Tax=Melastoma candidum TaxID=119954 RepID=A0ACB9RRY5_9MYRT|nr:hypothetical protein MLD38_007874 [Melastoma candidum]